MVKRRGHTPKQIIRKREIERRGPDPGFGIDCQPRTSLRDQEVSRVEVTVQQTKWLVLDELPSHRRRAQRLEGR